MFVVDQILFEKYRASVDLTNFPKKFMSSWYEQATPEELTQWYTERFRCLKYHLFLSGYVVAQKAGDPDLPPAHIPILGMDFQDNPHSQLFSRFVQKRPGEHFVLSDLETLTKKMMILWPRGLYKTSAVIVDIVQTILNYPNVRMCFLTGGDNLAKSQLARVKRVFEKPTKRFRHLFPEFCLVSKRVKRRVTNETTGKTSTILEWEDELCEMGTAHEFTVPCRTMDIFAESTFTISTARSVKAGSHYDIIYIDDLVNETNYRSVIALEKCYQNYIDICPLLEPTGYIVMTGTRYSFGDTYERIQELAKDEERRVGHTIWKFSIRDCWSMGCRNCPHTDVYHDYGVNILQPPCTTPGCPCIGFQPNGAKGVLFPETRTVDGRPIGHTLEFLESKRHEYGDEFFANQYENRPIAAGAQTFTETLIGQQTIHNLSDIPPYAAGSTFVVGDLAYVGQAGRDSSVLYVCRLFQGQIFIFDCLFGNWDSEKVAENTVNALLRHRPDVMYYEKFNGWEAYDKIITTYAAAKGIQKIPIQWEKGSQANNAKLIRIGSVKGVLTSKRLWLYAGMPGYQKLVQQLTKWPKLGKHDDFADCAGMVIAAPTGYQLSNPPQEVSIANWLHKLHAVRIEEDGYTDNGCGTGIVCSWVMFLIFLPLFRGIFHCLFM